jgi:uncharacterized protein YjbI with pentapeptide repeats
MTTLTQITPAEFVKKFMSGERDFSNTRMEGNLARENGFAELNTHVTSIQNDLRDNPILCNGVDWSGLQAPGFVFMSAKMAGANLSGADLSGADLRRGDYSGANFKGATLRWTVLNNGRYMEADFSDADCQGAEFYEANFSKAKFQNVNFAGAYTLRANFGEADFTNSKLIRADFYRSDLRGAIGLETVSDLGTCHFKNTVVTARERDIIEAARNAVPLFDLRTEMTDPPRGR